MNELVIRHFTKITMLKIEAEQLNDDIKLGNTGPIPLEEL